MKKVQFNIEKFFEALLKLKDFGQIEDAIRDSGQEIFLESNDEYEASRKILKSIPSEKIEMPRNKSNALCCGGGGGQMFKEAEKGTAEVNHARTEDVVESKAEIVATGCPFCNTMMTDGVKAKEKESDVTVMDVAELIANAKDL